MTEPFTTPTNIPRTTPHPRNPDGSPVPRKLARERRLDALIATETDEQALVQAYGKGSEELAQEAEEGYEVVGIRALTPEEGQERARAADDAEQEAIHRWLYAEDNWLASEAAKPQPPVKRAPRKKAAPKPPVTP